MLHKEIFEPDSTESAFFIVIAQKRDGSLRFRFIYGKRNARTASDLYHPPRIDEYIDFFLEARILSA